jgi:anti-sigma regulatory factor (Ser/Thr protein kinase)
MGESTRERPATLRVFRYRVGDDQIQTVIGPADLGLPQADLPAYAMEALTSSTFMFSTVAQQDDAFTDDLCFVPRGDFCDILSIHTDGRIPRHGDQRRSLVDILGTLAGAVACGSLLALDRSELETEETAGTRLLGLSIKDSAALAVAREAADAALKDHGVHGLLRQRTVLAISEATTNILLHGGGHGHLTLRRLDDRLRFVVADQGTGLNFLNWNGRPTATSPNSMGYGFKIILDYLDAVGLHSGPSGTTLILDRKTD